MPQTILVPLDLHQPAVFDSVFEAVGRQVRIEPATVVLLNVELGHYATAYPYMDSDYVARYTRHARKELTRIGEERLDDRCDWRIEVELGPVARTIVRAADRLEADLIILASHNPVVWDVFLGSTAAQVVKHARHSVLVVRQANDVEEDASKGAKTERDTAGSSAG
ncbi:universal stress protein [Salinisphaera sp. RV14]|uniref:universal stress protein n=1 Tax=unclassified Salinisphaera TaxID=2649847 RepID=UPI003F82A5DE